MKMAFLIFKYFPYGGLQLDFRRMLIEAVARGHQVTVLYGRWEGPFVEGATYRVLPPFALTNWGKALSFEWNAMMYFQREKFDLIAGFNRMSGLDVFFAADNCFAMNSARKPKLLRFLTRRYSVYERQERAVFAGERIPVILCLTDRQKKEYQSVYRTPEEKFFLLPPGIDADRKRPDSEEEVRRIRAEVRAEFSMNDDTLFLVQVCSGFHTKGVDRVLYAFRSLPEEILGRSKLVIVGHEKSRRYDNLAGALNLKNRVIFTGSRDDVGRLLLGADLMVHPARNEAAGTVLVESIAAGLPLVCSGNCGYAPFVRESGGRVLSEPFSQSEFNDTLAAVLETPGRLEEMRREVIRYSGTMDYYHRARTAVNIMEESAAAMNCGLFQTAEKGSSGHFPYPDSEGGPSCPESCGDIEREGRMCEVRLNEDFRELWKGENAFEAAFRLTGESFRRVKSRHTFRFEIGGKGYFAKLHTGCGWREVFKNLIQFKRPVMDAGPEYRALIHLKHIGVDTMTPCAFGRMGINPAGRVSFLITAELTNTVSLEDYCRDWSADPPPFSVKAALTRKLGETVGKMHRSGLNHRDCYLCHFLLEKGTEEKESPSLFVIDLHRAQIRKSVPTRYRIKDMGGLYFSAMDAGLTRHDLLRFIRAYSGKPLRETLSRDRAFYHAADETAHALYRKVHRKSPPSPR